MKEKWRLLVNIPQEHRLSYAVFLSQRVFQLQIYDSLALWWEVFDTKCFMLEWDRQERLVVPDIKNSNT